MAQRNDSSTLKQDASRKMEEGRAELDAEIHRMRVQLSPSRIAHSTMEQHTFAVLGVALALGILVPLVLFRHSGAPASRDSALDDLDNERVRLAKKKKSSASRSFLVTMAKTATPLLIRWFLKSRLDPQPAESNTAAASTPGVDEFTPGAA